MSMGGAIDFQIWENGKLEIQHLKLDGAPLVSAGNLLSALMVKQYLEITHKAQERDSKIADRMSDQTIRNMVTAASLNQISKPTKRSGKGVLYVYGTVMNELLSKELARVLKRCTPKAQLLCSKEDVHCKEFLETG